MVSKKEYEVIVIGAGPAGSSTAKYAAKTGSDVLLVDSKIEIGVPDKCGEFVPSLKEMKKLAPNAMNLEDLFDPPKHCIVNYTKRIRFVFGRSKEVTIPLEGIVVERKLFDKYLANEAARSGAEISPKTSINEIMPNEMVVKGRDFEKKIELKAKSIVGADGTVSLVAKRFGLPASRSMMDYAVGYQYEMVNIDHDPECVDMFFGEDIAPGTYAWIIPKGDGIANVGTGMRLPFMKRGLTVRDYQNNFIKHELVSNKLRKAKITAIKAGYIPVGGPIGKTYTSNSLVVGDAAGQTIPTVGGGIPPSLICGRIAGEALSEYIKGGAPLEKYESEWKKQMGTVLTNSLRLRKMSDAIFKSNTLLDLAIKTGLLNEDTVNKLVLCQIDSKMELIEKTLPILGALG